MKVNKKFSPVAIAMVLAFALSACNSDVETSAKVNPTKEQAKIAKSAVKFAVNPQKDVYFGDTHVHTSYSLDAYLGGYALDHEGAYSFAKGETIEMAGKPFKITEPLDFVALTDHAEYIGELYAAQHQDSPGHNTKEMQEFIGLETYQEREHWFLKNFIANNRSPIPQRSFLFPGEDTVKTAWKMMVDTADKHNDPGTFTTIPAYEWSCASKGGNLHRNIFFRDSNVPELPMSYIEINREEALWDWLATLEEQGMDVFAIAHNSNASKQMMFASVDSKGNPLTPEYAELRNRFEPAIEMMQVKGNSEVHASFWTSDEFADFENADSIQNYSKRTYTKNNFVRDGIAQGLKHKEALGTNPFEFGFVGGTDTHNGTPGNVDESNFINGSHGEADGTVDRRRNEVVGGWISGKDVNPGAITGVWAESNTRGAIWDGMKRKETYATSGSRMKLRMFAGFDLPKNPKDYKEFVEQGLAKGHPMGTNFNGKENGPLVFNIWALKDANGANLDRLQVVKSSLLDDGTIKEKVFNVAWSGDRTIDAQGNVPAVGNTVDATTATYTNDIGSSELLTSWVDPEFDPNDSAVYYVRAIEIPTPRWTTYDAVRANKPLMEGVPVTVQERAWGSPVWYYPGE
ncbi:DUF3604 domain-containing protein [Thalassotalea sp. PLHSN55]|uniref:DUF3604 domain-containing protein n=1 Tax=Thalassotalea sp. PLHSN55 TaxID=3435888 RepID=UPI003F8347AA